jgi:hemerythrin superfamily protein
MPTQMEKAASKVMGTAKKAKGMLEGLSGVFRTLMKEHGEVSALLLRVKASDDLETRARLWTTIRKELLAHEKGELAVVYPHYEKHPETSQLAVEHNEEASQLASLIGQLEDMGVESKGWESLFDDLVKLVQHHVSEEESKIFPVGQQAFADVVDELDAQYKQKKSDVLAQL